MTGTSIDAEWAWSPYRPTPDQPWSPELAAHLYRRAGFGANRDELAEAANCDPAELVDQLLAAASGVSVEDTDDFAQTILATGNPKLLGAWWVYRMLGTPAPLLEKATLFWHGHFATSAEKVKDAQAMYEQNRLLRQFALGDFAALVHHISRDPAMLVYLDSTTNRKSHPNENYARELMELFCLGEGNYREQDVQELARCFTGWEVRRGSFRFNRYQHDTQQKGIFGKTGSFPGGEAIDVVLSQESAPRFIAGKLVRYFVFDEPQPTAELIEPLAQQLRQDELNVGPTVRRILNSRLFFSPHAIGRKIRSPVDLLVGLLRTLQGTANCVQLGEDLKLLGQGLFYPPNVKGWEGGRRWINSSTLLGRANVVGRLVRDDKTRFAGGDLAEYFSRLGDSTAAAIVQRFNVLLLAVPLPQPARERLIQFIDRAGTNRSEGIAAALQALSMLPQFQLG